MSRAATKCYQRSIILPDNMFDTLKKSRYGGENMFDLICLCSSRADATKRCNNLGISTTFTATNSIAVRNQDIIDMCAQDPESNVVIKTFDNGINSYRYRSSRYVSLKSIFEASSPIKFKAGEEVYDVQDNSISTRKFAVGPMIYLCPRWSLRESNSCLVIKCDSIERQATVLYKDRYSADGEGIRTVYIAEKHIVSHGHFHPCVEKTINAVERLQSKFGEYTLYGKDNQFLPIQVIDVRRDDWHLAHSKHNEDAIELVIKSADSRSIREVLDDIDREELFKYIEKALIDYLIKDFCNKVSPAEHSKYNPDQITRVISKMPDVEIRLPSDESSKFANVSKFFVVGLFHQSIRSSYTPRFTKNYNRNTIKSLQDAYQKPTS